MSGLLVTVCLVYFLFAATTYVGTLWCLHFFLYPTWVGLTPDNVGVHFVGPTRAATRFFTYVVPPMFVTGPVMVAAAWGDPVVIAPVLAVLGIIVSTYVGQRLIIPVNKRIAAGVTSQELTPLLKRWMRYNDIRWVTTSIMWAATVWYAVAEGNLVHVLGS